MNRRHLLVAVGGLESRQVEVPAWPDKPDSLTRENVVQFVLRYEEAFRARETLPPNTDNVETVDVSASVTDEYVTRTDTGWLVHPTVPEPELVLRTPTPAPSPHYDPGISIVSYFVSDDAVFRSWENEVDPREKGTELDCHRTGSSSE